MHRGYPADKILTDMMRSIHRYFEFPRQNLMAAGLGGGHSGFTAAVMHLMNPNIAGQRIYVDTTKPEASGADNAGLFRQSWATQLVELQQFAGNGDPERIRFATAEGAVPRATELEAFGTTLFIGVGHETTGANSYSRSEVEALLAWLEVDPDNRHAVLDATSMLGAMPWGEALVRRVLARCCLFMPLQKAIGGISGYFVASFTPQALKLVESNQNDPAWAIPRQLNLAPPADPRRPLSARRSVAIGPFYDAGEDRMLGGVINTYSALAFAETTFGLLQTARRVGSVSEPNRRSIEKRRVASEWIDGNCLLKFVVGDPDKRGAAVMLLRVDDPDIGDRQIHARIIARSKQLLGCEGITHVDGHHEKGLDAARYVNAFPGMAGDYRAWIGGIRAPEDVRLLLDNLAYGYRRAKIAVLEEELAARGERFGRAASVAGLARKDDPERAYTVLIADLLGLRFGTDGAPDSSEISAYVREKGGEFHLGPMRDRDALQKGKIHVFYQPQLSTELELLRCTGAGQYDALIAAATFIPAKSVFPFGGVRIGAGTGNMGSETWGGPDGEGGTAPLMNTPGINSRATAHMVMKALIKVVPDLPVAELHARVMAGRFDTGRDLKDFPTEKLEGQKLAVLGYGNIGREVARLGKAFGMRVCVYARQAHRDWIQAEGFEFADNPVDAARNANALTVHIGLGRLDLATGACSNAGAVGHQVLSSLADGAVLINYDRGELVDIEALEAALQSGKVTHVAVDADIFNCPDEGTVKGPLAPYVPLSARYPGKVELLPHVVADTDHPTRVAGAKQAIDQIFGAIRFGAVRNLKGTLPEGYVDLGSTLPVGIGTVTSASLAAFADRSEQLRALRRLSERIAAVLGGIDATTDPASRTTLVERYYKDLAFDLLNHRRLVEEAGILSPAVAR